MKAFYSHPPALAALSHSPCLLPSSCPEFASIKSPSATPHAFPSLHLPAQMAGPPCPSLPLPASRVSPRS